MQEPLYENGVVRTVLSVNPWTRLNSIEYRRHLSKGQQLDYINAVKCLWRLPARGKEYFPVQTRHDDFVALHMNATGPADPITSECLRSRYSAER
jgi:hypothetical protein